MTAKIICDDALQAVSKLEAFDYVITDPPYPTGGESSIKSVAGVKAAREMIDGMAQSFICGVLREIPKADNFSIWLFCDWRQVSYFSSILRGMGLPVQSCIVWDKLSGSLSARYYPSHELILWASSSAPPKIFLGRDLIQCKRIKGNAKRHPFDKPPQLITELCKAFPKGRVLDPFCGGGGLLLGAQQLGWNCTGIDIDRDACNTTTDRLNQMGGQ